MKILKKNLLKNLLFTNSKPTNKKFKKENGKKYQTKECPATTYDNGTKIIFKDNTKIKILYFLSIFLKEKIFKYLK